MSFENIMSEGWGREGELMFRMGPTVSEFNFLICLEIINHMEKNT